MKIGKRVDNAIRKEDRFMNTASYRRLDFNKIANRITSDIPVEDALRDIIPIKWSEDVLSGKKRVVITKEDTKK